ncbi:unnamed protein product [Ixodes pacificus]
MGASSTRVRLLATRCFGGSLSWFLSLTSRPRLLIAGDKFDVRWKPGHHVPESTPSMLRV